ncbi:MAG: ABC-type transport system involved in multi-copper enzyme maturation permease subunit [Myxococcota bacterium]
MTSLRDAWLVAVFEVRRSIRTWRALALIVLYMVATAGAAYLFIEFIGSAEQSIAVALGVPVTETPGAMLDELRESEPFRRGMGAMVGGEDALDALLVWPVLAIFHLWLSFLLVPFFAASASAESIAIDVQSRGLRFEALRTGRLEIVLGRFGGQLLLTGLAAALSIVGVWAVGMMYMVGHTPVGLAVGLVWLGGRAWLFSVPFVGLGVACSQLTASPAWARVMAIAGVAGSWVLYGIARWLVREGEAYAVVGDLLLQVLPQGWLRGFWAPGVDWWVSGLVCIALGLVALSLGFLRFTRRDL